MSAGHAYELTAEEPEVAVAGALAEVQAGQIAYLTHAGQTVAALVPPGELTALQHAADAHAIAEAHAVASRPGPQIPHAVLEAMMTADDATHDAMATALDAHADQDMRPDEVTALWERINTRRA
jgi:antitoxin (DNA-binding transcriptional repressor) of toxin-antitoxin stability system